MAAATRYHARSDESENRLRRSVYKPFVRSVALLEATIVCVLQ